MHPGRRGRGHGEQQRDGQRHRRPAGPAITTPPDTTITPIASTPALTIDKTAGTPAATTAGGTIAYSFLVTNTGNVTLTGIAITDASRGAAVAAR